MHATDDPNDSYLGSGYQIQAAIKKYGRSSFKKEVLFVFGTPEEMAAKEAELVTSEFVDREDNYNIVVGGKQGKSWYQTVNDKMKGRKLSEETKAKMRKPKSIEHAANIAVGKRGGSHSPETKKKMSISHISRPGKPLRGPEMTPEIRAKISASKTGRSNGPLSELTKRKISEAHARRRQARLSMARL
jgi:hypothetical protein